MADNPATMKFLVANHSSYPRVGEGPGQQTLRRTIDRWEKKEVGDEDLHQAQDEVTLAVIQEQEKAGADIVTDGQIRWYDPVSHMLRGVGNIEINGLLRFYDTNFYFRQPVIKGAPQWKQSVLTESFASLRTATRGTTKAIVTGPYTLAHLSIHSNGTVLPALAGLVAQEVAALAAAGAEWIQIEEPHILHDPGDFSAFSQALHTVTEKRGRAKVLLTTYFADAAPLYDKFQNLPVDALGFDLTYSRTLAEAIAGGTAKPLALGVVDARTTRLERISEVVKTVEKLAQKQKTDVTLMPSCGLEYLPRERAYAKLKLLADVRKELR